MNDLVVFWFRRDLRLVDNVGLYYALTDGRPVLPVFIFDKNILDDLTDKQDARVTFIHNQIARLDQKLRSRGSGMQVHFDTPMEAFSKLMDTYSIKAVYTNRDYEPYARERDSQMESIFKEEGIDFFTFKDHVIFEQGEILNDQGEPYKVFTPFKNRWLDRFSKLKLTLFDSESKLDRLYQGEIPAIPTLESMVFSSTSIALPTADLDLGIVKNYAEKRNFPGIAGTTRLGIHLRFGTVSIRKLTVEGLKYSDVWLSELIWREFYIMILAHFPHVVNQAFKPAYDRIVWLNDETQFKKWCDGQTGYPIVDAGMRELNATGFMHNRVRMIVASFLTKHLLIDWRWGEHYFAAKLLDFELASNNGGWQWAAGTGTDAQPYFRVFNPQSQQEKFDQYFSYIKKWVPEYLKPEYPKPIVDHKMARERAIKTYKEALS